MALLYGFDFTDAERAFRTASRFDPASPMPYWGIAMANGPNYNAPFPTLPEERAASDALAQARLRAPEVGLSHDLIAALTLRLDCVPRPNYTALNSAYAGAMRGLAGRYPDLADVQTLFAESLMSEHAWRLWGPAGAPGPDTREILSVLGSTLQRWPDDIGANHLYIHAVEASPHPELGLRSAQRMAAIGAAVGQGGGHLLHMAAHIYMRTGDYVAAEASTRAAFQSDRPLLENPVANPAYALGYAVHNLVFLMRAAEADGDLAQAQSAANELARVAEGARGEGEHGGGALDVGALEVPVRFGLWQSILAIPARPEAVPFRAAFAHFARGCAFAGLGQLPQALRERAALRSFLLTPEAPRAVGIPALPARIWYELAVHSLDARIQAARNQPAAGATQWRQAMAAADALPYAEPPAWPPVAVSLGAALLQAGDARAAEAAFRNALTRWPSDPRALFGLESALRRQNRIAEAETARREYLSQWRGASPPRLSVF
ncbi:MAG TPA: hypothetical protein VN690_02530 [Terriglobales bacterium]|nr:hypothetical protein [Terriglobales bacterium]